MVGCSSRKLHDSYIEEAMAAAHLVEGHVLGAGLVVEGAGAGVAHHALAPPGQLCHLVRAAKAIDQVILGADWGTSVPPCVSLQLT